MEWTTPTLIDINSEEKGSFFCHDGITPKLLCHAGACHWDECWAGGSKPAPVICMSGISEG